jgi:tetratricopeptide (TPR) repeat protein
MQHKTIRLFFAALLICALPAIAQNKARMRGKVVNEAGQPIVGATVTLRIGEDGPEPFATNDKGEWAYLGLISGTWLVLVEMEGYVSAEVEIPLKQIDRGKTPINMTLREITPEMLGQANPAVAHIEAGNAFLEEGQTTEARAEYEAALETLDPESHAYVYLTIARTYYLEENMAETEVVLRKVLELEPDNVNGLKLLSNLLISSDREVEAQAFMARLPEGEELPADAYLNVGIDLYNSGDLDSALVEFEEAAVLYPDEPMVYYYRGLVLIAQGKNDLAAADFRRLLELESEGPRVDEAKEFLKYLE